jgi:hypothetical protein
MLHCNIDCEPGDAGRIKALVRNRLGLGDDATLMVSELRCHEDGCPDVETVIAVMTGGKDTETWKIAKPMADVGADDIAAIAAG